MDESLLPKELQTKTEKDLPKATKAIAGKSRIRKRGIGQRISDILAIKDISEVKEYIIWDQIVPSLQNGLYNFITDTVGNTIAMMFWGVTGGGKKKSGSRSNASWSPYPSETYYSYDRVDNRRDNRPERRKRPSSNRLEEAVVDNRGDAVAALDELVNYMDQYGRVPVSAYYEAFDIARDGIWTDKRWGWTSLAEAQVVPVRGGGWTVYLPNPEPF